MKKSKLFSIAFSLGAILLFGSCSKNEKNTGNSSQLQIRLTDGPDPSVKAVWVDIQQIEILMDDSSKPLILNGSHPGLYNLLDFSDGKDTLLADATIPPGTINQIRLILGDNNYIITQHDIKIPLKTPSAQESGLKVQIHQVVNGGILYSLTVDFDAVKSIVKAGNSGNYLLKPVLRILSLVPSGGDIFGVVTPDSAKTFVFAIQGIDTIASTSTDTSNGKFLFKDIPAGNYSIFFLPSDSSLKETSLNTVVALGEITNVDTIRLQH